MLDILRISPIIEAENVLLHTSHACVCNCSRFCPTNMGISTNSILCQLALFKIVNGLFMLVPVALVMVVLSLSRVQLLGPPWAVVLQASLSMGFPQESWSGWPFPSSRIFPTQGSNPGLLHCRHSLSLSHLGNPTLNTFLTGEDFHSDQVLMRNKASRLQCHMFNGWKNFLQTRL